MLIAGDIGGTAGIRLQGSSRALRTCLTGSIARDLSLVRPILKGDGVLGAYPETHLNFRIAEDTPKTRLRLPTTRVFRPSGLERTKTATNCFSESNARPKTQREVSEPGPPPRAGSILWHTPKHTVHYPDTARSSGPGARVRGCGADRRSICPRLHRGFMVAKAWFWAQGSWGPRQRKTPAALCENDDHRSL